MKVNKVYNGGFTDEEIYSVDNTRLGRYRQCGTNQGGTIHGN